MCSLETNFRPIVRQRKEKGRKNIWMVQSQLENPPLVKKVILLGFT